jgi:hypothetical protein
MNSCLENLNLSLIDFKEIEIKLIGEYLMNNKSITKLNFSNSNYSSSFDFLKNNFKANKLIKVLNLSYEFQSTICNLIVNDFINIMSEQEGNVKELTLNRMSNFNKTLNFHKLLKN